MLLVGWHRRCRLGGSRSRRRRRVLLLRRSYILCFGCRRLFGGGARNLDDELRQFLFECIIVWLGIKVQRPSGLETIVNNLGGCRLVVAAHETIKIRLGVLYLRHFNVVNVLVRFALAPGQQG